MTADDFRNLARAEPGVSESAHMGHPDFRVGGKIFASLGYPDADWGMVKLTPAQQKELAEEDPLMFVPCRGAWGRQGCTNVRLAAARTAVLRRALALAIRNVVEQAAAKKSRPRPARPRAAKAKPGVA